VGRLSKKLRIVCRRLARKDIWRRRSTGSTFVAVNALLLADSENDTREFLGRHLTRDGFEVLEACEGGEALVLAEQAQPDLVLLSSMLPDSAGVDVCTRLREGEPGRSWNREVPVILLGDERSDPIDRVRAFARGADDYVVPPLVYEELLGRIRAVLRRTNGLDRDRVVAGDLLIDRRTRDVTVGGNRVMLATKEYELLLKLASEPARVFTKEQLLREVWGFRSLGRTRTLDSHASRLRRKLAAVSERLWVINVWGVGYRLLSPADTPGAGAPTPTTPAEMPLQRRSS
jgi:DNA-binding response OmpR family regulator